MTKSIEAINAMCLSCKNMYQLNLIKPGNMIKNTGIKLCPYCGDSKLAFFEWDKTQFSYPDDIYVLITVSGGIIDQAKFYPDGFSALGAMSMFIKIMNVDNQDAVIFSKDGFYANAKYFLDKGQ